MSHHRDSSERLLQSCSILNFTSFDNLDPYLTIRMKIMHISFKYKQLVTARWSLLRVSRDGFLYKMHIFVSSVNTSSEMEANVCGYITAEVQSTPKDKCSAHSEADLVLYSRSHLS